MASGTPGQQHCSEGFVILPQHHAQLFHVNPHLALQILGQHLAFEVELLQPVLQVHNTLESKESCVRERTALHPNCTHTAQTPNTYCLPAAVSGRIISMILTGKTLTFEQKPLIAC